MGSVSDGDMPVTILNSGKTEPVIGTFEEKDSTALLSYEVLGKL